MTASIAIFGANGLLAQPVIDALTLATFESKVGLITVVTREEPKQRHNGVEYVIADISNHDQVPQVVAALNGVDAIVGLNAPFPQVYAGIEAVLKQVKPKLYIPSQFGVDIARAQQILPGFLLVKTDHSKAVRTLGIKVVDVFTSLFHSPNGFSYEIVGHYGVDSDGLVTQRGNPKQKISMTATGDVGKVVAALATALDYSKLPDVVRVESDQVTPEVVQQTWAKNHGKTLTVVKSIDQAEALAEVQSDWKANGFLPDKFLFYLHSLTSQGVNGGLLFVENDNQLVNPGIWQWEKFHAA